ncbi:MAG: hypothetical protein ACLFWH_04580 [Actinomycetota bacterium]
MLRFVQTAVDNMRRVAQAGRELWVDGFEQPLLATGITHAELLETEAEPAAESLAMEKRSPRSCGAASSNRKAFRRLSRTSRGRSRKLG